MLMQKYVIGIFLKKNSNVNKYFVHLIVFLSIAPLELHYAT